MSQHRTHQTAIQGLALGAITLLCALATPQAAFAGDINQASCPNETSPGFRTYLPDCRAYEMVTPPFKGGFPVSVEDISESGSRLYMVSLGAFSHPEDTGELGANYLAERSSDGWALAAFDAASSTFSGFRVEAVSPDLAESLWFARPSPQSSIPNFYLGASPRGPFEEVGPSGPASYGERALTLEGVSQDLSHSVYEALAPNLGSRSPLWPGDETAPLSQPSLYEYAGTNNEEPRLVGVSNVGPVASIPASHLISECGTYLGGLVNHKLSAYNAVSEDGNTVFFTALGRDYGVCGSADVGVIEPPVNELHARVDGTRSDAHTVAISEPTSADCSECSLSGEADAEFQGASFDGSKVFFTTEQHLLSAPTEASPDLYEYDFRGPEHKRVTRISAGDPAGAEVQKVVCVADDGSHVYFLARGVLTTTANAFGQHAKEGTENLYVYERDAAYPNGHVAYIGAGSVDNAQTTPDGRFLVFTSTTDLTPDQGESIEAGQVFEYDAMDGVLARVSRGEGGYNADGNSSVYAADLPRHPAVGSIPIAKFTGLAVSTDGAYVFFSSKDSLTPRAVSGVNNVYEYHEGHVALISDGVDLTNVNGESAVRLMGTVPSGGDVYFRIADQLVGQDGDTQLDTYDARIDGGFPAALNPPDCSSDSCQGSLSDGLQPPAPPTSSSEGESFAPTVSAAMSTGKAGVKPKSKKAKKKPKKRVKKPLRKAKKATRRRR